jgi:large conductance mechanosensitive channel
MLKEFKEFAMRGNVLDMAIGIVIGAAFGKIVTSFVSDILMPPIGLLMGGVDFSNIFIVLGEGDYASLDAAKEAGAATWNIGLFINTMIDFLIIAFAIFLVVKAINNMKRKEAVPPPAPSEKSCTFCATTIPIKATRCPNCTSQLESA